MTAHIVIVGGGPAGLLTALGLAKEGSRITVLEAGSELNDSPRALVYHHPVLPYLERLGILEQCISEGFVRQDFAWRVHSTGEMIRWSMSCLDDSTPHPYALHLHQGLLSAVVARELEKYSNVEVRTSTRCTSCDEHDDGVTVQAECNSEVISIDCDFVVGADGAGSFVRSEVLKSNFFGITWPNRYIATNTRINLTELDYCNTTMQLDHEYGAVICRIDDTHLWRVTFMEDPALPEEGIQERIHAKFVKHLPDIPYELVDYAPYRMHQRVADKMRIGRVLLVGDSAHVTNPTGGLGLTGGMFDSFTLVDVLNRVIHEGASDDLLEQYDRDRRRVYTEVASPRASDNLRRLYYLQPGEQKNDTIAWLRKVASSPDLMREQLAFTEQMESHL